MLMHAKELVVLLVLATAVFTAAKPSFLTFMRLEDFVLRRNVWLLLTTCAFLSPSFWIYAGFAIVVLAWAARRDSNPAGLYLLSFSIIPPISVYIPVVGINQLFALNQARILALVVLLPAGFALFSANKGGVARKWTALDWLLIGFVVLQVALISPYESVTNTMRRSLLFFLDTVIVYYVFSRSVASRFALLDAMGAFSLAGILYATVAIFESAKGWLLYEQLGPAWGASNDGAFLLRGSDLRAQASAGHSLTLGYTLAMALGFWLFLRGQVVSKTAGLAVTAVLCAGLYSTHSRGPWLAGIVVYFSYLLLVPGSKSRLFKGIATLGALGAVVAVTPGGSRILEMMPFIGSVDQDNVIYRQRLAQESWQLILHNPFFGDPFVLTRMEDLRQGQGIIDLMNAYAAMALFYGLIGAALFTAFFLVSAARAQAVKRTLVGSPGLAEMGAALVACMLASLFFMATASVDWFEYVLAGLLAAYATLCRQADARPQASQLVPT